MWKRTGIIDSAPQTNFNRIDYVIRKAGRIHLRAYEEALFRRALVFNRFGDAPCLNRPANGRSRIPLSQKSFRLLVFRREISLSDGMRVLVQRITQAKVTVEGSEVGRVGAGLCLFLGVAKDDTEAAAEHIAGKIAGMRIFADENGKLNRSLEEAGGEVLVVAEFTLYGDCSKGRRPSFSQAAPPEDARRLYDYFVLKLKDLGLKVATGNFQEKMEVSLVNDGPVTLIIDG
jgi:D-aminoacyl-tRNA deacylase